MSTTHWRLSPKSNLPFDLDLPSATHLSYVEIATALSSCDSTPFHNYPTSRNVLESTEEPQVPRLSGSVLDFGNTPQQRALFGPAPVGSRIKRSRSDDLSVHTCWIRYRMVKGIRDCYRPLGIETNLTLGKHSGITSQPNSEYALPVGNPHDRSMTLLEVKCYPAAHGLLSPWSMHSVTFHISQFIDRS